MIVEMFVEEVIVLLEFMIFIVEVGLLVEDECLV